MVEWALVAMWRWAQASAFTLAETEAQEEPVGMPERAQAAQEPVETELEVPSTAPLQRDWILTVERYRGTGL